MTSKFLEECEGRSWRRQTFLGTKILVVVPGAKRVKRIYLRMGSGTACCNAGESGKKLPKTPIINNNADEDAGETGEGVGALSPGRKAGRWPSALAGRLALARIMKIPPLV